MDIDTVVVERTYEERMDAYVAIFASSEECSFAKARVIWAEYLPKYVKPKSWRAAWYIPKERCSEFHLYYPRFVLVDVSMLVSYHRTSLLSGLCRANVN